MGGIGKARAAAAALAAALAMGGCGKTPPPPETPATNAAPTTQTDAAPTTTLHGVLDASELIVRSGPGLNTEAIGGMARGEELVIVGREGDWFKIRFGEGYGYISAAYADLDDQPNASEMLAAFTTVPREPTTSRTNPRLAGETATTTASAAATVTAAQP